MHFSHKATLQYHQRLAAKVIVSYIKWMTKTQITLKAVSAILWHGNKVLLVKRKNQPFQNKWSFPGGKIKNNETSQHAIEREILEETGLKAALLIPFSKKIINALKENSPSYEIEIFTGLIEAQPYQESSDALEARFFDIKEVQNIETTPDALENIKQAQHFLTTILKTEVQNTQKKALKEK